MGNGTSLTLKPKEERIKKGETIYTFVVELVLMNGFLQVSSQIKLDEVERRNLQNEAKYVMGGNIYLFEIQEELMEKGGDDMVLVIIILAACIVGLFILSIFACCIWKSY